MKPKKPTRSRATASRSPLGSEFSRDYVGIATAYAREAADEANRARFGKWIRLAARRFLKDMERAAGAQPPFVFDAWHASDPCDFIEKLPHVEGKWKNEAGEDQLTILLHRSDVFFIVQLFGFRTPEGTRRFTTALKAIARKNAKSTVAGAIGLYCQLCEGEVGPQVVSAATTGSQARIVFNIAKRMVEKTSALQEAFKVTPFANAIASYGNGGTFKPINSKASTQDGLNPSAAIVDEVHAHPTHDLLNVLRSAAGARANPLFLFTTTEGYESPGPWPELRHFMKQVLEGVVEADHFLCVYYAVDEEDKDAGLVADDDFDESAWIKANPLIEVNPHLIRELRKEATEAKSMPGRLAEFRIKRLNRSASVAGGEINLAKWRGCAGAVDLDWLRGFPCHGGLDLANTSDLTALRLVWLVESIFYTWGIRWVPEAKVLSRRSIGLVPYDAWVTGGFLRQTSGEVTDYGAVRAGIAEVRKRFDVRSISYDPWNAKQLVKTLVEEDEAPMVEFIQGPKSYHPAMQELERAHLAGNLRHGGDPVLTWCASNLVARKDVNLNKAPDKRKSFEKIDDMSALYMGMSPWVVSDDAGPSVYEERGVLAV